MSDSRPSDVSNTFAQARGLFEAALDWPTAERAARLRQACGGDGALQALVERMLQADAEPHRVLDATAVPAPDRLQPGDLVGAHLHVVSLLGRGGMGEVYRAHDSTLGRDVAVKILPQAAGANGDAQRERLARFTREAQVLASLNHPNIAAIYGIEGWPAPPGAEPDLVALVLELVEGPTLADRLAAGSLSVAEVLPLATQIAEALEAAHDRGIVHRDLKPANVSLRPDGTVKLLDFGLAKIARIAEPDSPAPAGPVALSIPGATNTGRGPLLGTPAYMSPEQARGGDVDPLTDIWAFGAVLYEMLAARRAFPGVEAADVVEAVRHRPIEWSALDPSTPPAMRLLLARCLERDPRRRLQDIGEARIALEDLSTAVAIAAPPVARQKSWGLVAAVTAAVSGLVIAAIAWWPVSSPVPAPVSRFTIETSPAEALDVDPQSIDVAITRNGSHIVYKGGRPADGTRLFVRRLDQLDAIALTPPGRPKAPFISPDGQWVGYFEPAAGGPVLKKVAITGGPPVELGHVDAASRGATWGADGVIILATAAPATGLQQVSSNGGSPVILTRPARDRGEADHLWPHLLPGGRAVLFTITPLTGGIEASQVAVLDLAAGTWKALIRGGRQAHYVPSGHLVYMAGTGLAAIAFDLARLETRGTATVMVPSVVTLPNGTAEYDVADNGTLIYAGGPGLAPRRTLAWVDRSGHEDPIAGAPERPYAAVRLSPDATRLALEIGDGDNDVWVWDLTRRTLTRVSTDPGLDQSPIWARDGRSLIFTSQTGGAVGSLFRQVADGSGTAERLIDGRTVQRATAMLPDGTGVLYDEQDDIRRLRVDGARAAEPILQTPQVEQYGTVSPDGRWLAYVGSDGGPRQVFVRPFPNVDSARTQASTAGGTQPVWARNGRELFYVAPDGALMLVPMGRGGLSGVGRRVVAPGYFDGSGLTAPRTYDVSPDGRRFLVIKPAASGEVAVPPVRMVVALNWFEELKSFEPR
ncbi:MAG: protein kinase [Vicinamibacteraceae bacterium]